MNEQIFIKPAEGLLVRDPDTREPLPAEGDFKPRSTYWLRRLDDRDVIEAKPPKSDKKEVTS